MNGRAEAQVRKLDRIIAYIKECNPQSVDAQNKLKMVSIVAMDAYKRY